jgi:hypothetical protein
MRKEIKEKKIEKMRKCCYFLFVLLYDDESIFRSWEPSVI